MEFNYWTTCPINIHFTNFESQQLLYSEQEILMDHTEMQSIIFTTRSITSNFATLLEESKASNSDWYTRINKSNKIAETYSRTAKPQKKK
ncbi:Periodic tryptophan protein [Dirofilaria immitis]